ncbi:MAG: hypothetical protein ACI9MC_002443, partial [Kiritimatiellia bacterium]
MRNLAAGLLLQSALISCTFTPPPTVPAPSSLGWPDDLVKHPENFQALMDTSSREGWVAIHGHRYEPALDQFQGDTPLLIAGQHRATAALSQLHADLARAQATASTRYFKALKGRDALPTDSAAGRIASLSASCSGPSDAYTNEATEAFTAVRNGWSESDDLVVSDDLSAFRDRHAVHIAARGGQPSALTDVARNPLIVEPAQGFVRTWWDPCLHSTLADAWDSSAPEPMTDDTTALSTVLFSAWPQLSDLQGPEHAPASMKSWTL